MYENPEWYWDIEQEVSDQILYWRKMYQKKKMADIWIAVASEKCW